MPDYNIIIFDLDGTLTDPTQEMLSSAKYALEQFHIRKVDPEKLKLFLEVPLLMCFEEHFGLTHDQANQAFLHYWYYAGSFGVGQNVPYDGVEELLQALRQNGKAMGIATARKTPNAEQILRATKLTDFFTHIMGASEDESRRTKKMILFDVLCEFPEHDNEDVVMVGDRVVDIIGARDNGVDSIGVTFGQEPAEDIIKAEPTYVANSVEEMAALLLNHT
ncbi:MAG: HAD-IA family hydrolase [Phycisphaerae bacterium]|nr:HAD-IA family hydrolase [Phycisphaerae bacterium]